ncbi:MAG: ribonucleotide reductase N-terminal alpha domain-containing protein, partial [Dehalococcoidia bacterium]|nr:ribonucleotide reductase N-terminal alpha domain-containing protein [Dehalococcoidia bacterium]
MATKPVQYSKMKTSPIDFKPEVISENANVILQKRYLQKDNNGKVTETPDGMFRRVAKALAEPE